jgi:GT2 family glycosyltransferase
MAENRIVGFYSDGAPGGQRAPASPVSVLAPSGLVSILIPCCGQLEYTKLCVPSVLRHSREPFELIFLDIGSLDGTAEYLAGVITAAHVRIETIRTQTDLGIADVVREAIAHARGEYLVLLNNDAIVTDAWLNQLVALASMSPAIGLVGPMSNYASSPQLVENVPYRIGPRRALRPTKDRLDAEILVNVEEVNKFAGEHRDKNKGKWMETDRLGGFCLLIKRHVLDKIGPLSQLGDLSLFDSDVVSAKARQAGFTLACCRDLFVHHFGTRTFAHGAPSSTQAKPAPAPA